MTFKDTPHESFSLDRYKQMLRAEIARYRQEKGSSFTQSALATRLRIEASYLSRCLNHSQSHPSRELLFRILREVGATEARILEHLEAYDLCQASSVEYRHFLEFRKRVAQTRRSLEKLVSMRPRIRRLSYELEKIAEVVDASDVGDTPTVDQ